MSRRTKYKQTLSSYKWWKDQTKTQVRSKVGHVR